MLLSRIWARLGWESLQEFGKFLLSWFLAAEFNGLFVRQALSVYHRSREKAEVLEQLRPVRDVLADHPLR